MVNQVKFNEALRAQVEDYFLRDNHKNRTQSNNKLALQVLMALLPAKVFVWSPRQAHFHLFMTNLRHALPYNVTANRFVYLGEDKFYCLQGMRDFKVIKLTDQPMSQELLDGIKVRQGDIILLQDFA